MTLVRTSLVFVALAASLGRADAQETGNPPVPPREAPKGPPRIRMGGDEEEAAPAPEETAPAQPQQTEPEQWMAALANWPAAEARQASIRLATEPTIAWPLLERKLREPDLDWRIVAGAAATLGKMRELRAIDLIRGKLEDRRMYQHSAELVEALVRIDPPGAKLRLTQLLLHPAAPVVAEAEKLLAERVAPTDLQSLRDVYDAGGASARAAALRLGVLADREGVRPDLVKALRDKDCDVAFAAAQALATDDSPEALELTLRGAAAPIDRQFAYSVLSLAVRSERGGARVVDDALVRTLLSGRGLKSLDPLCRNASAVLLADVGYFHDVPLLDESLDKVVVPTLMHCWLAREFWPDMKVLQPLVQRRIRRLTGRLDLATPEQWAAWWERAAPEFVANRVLASIPEAAVPTLLVTLRGTGAPGGETTVFTAAAEMLGPQTPDELAILLAPEDASALARVIEECGVLRAPEGIAAAASLPDSVQVTVRAGRRERHSSLRTDPNDASVARFLAHVEALRTRNAWQRYRTAATALDAQSFVMAMSKAFAPERPEVERAASLASLIVQAIDPRRGDAWNTRALADLESMPLLPEALGSAEADRLLVHLGARAHLDPVARGIAGVLAKAHRAETLAPLTEFLVTRGGAEGRPLLVAALRAATREQRLAALEDERVAVRLAAFEALDASQVDDQVLARLLKSVDDADRPLAAEALRTLGRLRIEEARPLLDRYAEASSAMRPAAIEALGLMGGKDSLSTIMTAFVADDQGVRIAAVNALAAAREPEGISAVVFAMANDPSPLVREVASRAVLELGTDRAALELRKVAIDPTQSPGLRARALSGFVQLRGRAAAADLARLVADPAEEVADAAALGLATWRDPAAVPRLLEMLQKERAVHRARAGLESVSLESFPQRDPQLLADLYGGWWDLSKDRGPRRWLLDALTAEGADDAALRAWAEGGGGREVVPSLLKALRHEKWYLRRAADLALREIFGRSVGDQDAGTSAADVERMALAWEKAWAESIGR